MSQLVVRTSQPPSLGQHLAPLRLFRSLAANRQLIRNFASRELLERHKGAILGIGWNILSPMLQLAIYTLVFGYIFGQRWDKGNLPAHLDFPLTFFAGNAMFNVFAESVNRAPTAVSSRSNLVRKVVFPVEILPVTLVYAAVIHAAITLAILLLIMLGALGLGFWTSGSLHWHVVLTPIAFIPLILWSLAFAWVLSAVGVFLRDVRHIVVVFTQLVLFCTPVFYSLDRIPPEQHWLHWLISHNPMHIIVDTARRTLLWGEMPDWFALSWVTAAGLIAALLGHGVFSMLRRSMADVH